VGAERVAEILVLESLSEMFATSAQTANEEKEGQLQLPVGQVGSISWIVSLTGLYRAFWMACFIGRSGTPVHRSISLTSMSRFILESLPSLALMGT
jgi:hypothetical protein